MKLRSARVWQFALTLAFSSLAAISACAQTRSELRARYGEPETSQPKGGPPVVERYLARPNIVMTVTYSNNGQPCELIIAPEKTSNSDTAKTELIPNGDLMPTALVIEIINELAPIERRGKKTNEFKMNGGDPKMKLHHPGCTGVYGVLYENVTISSASWCWGGTFSATIHWGKTRCRGQTTSREQAISVRHTNAQIGHPTHCLLEQGFKGASE